MKDFTLKKGLVGNGLFVPSSFKSFMVMVVMIIMTTSSAMAQDAKFEVIDGFRYLLFTGTKTASLIASTKEKYSGDIVVPEKVKSSNGWSIMLLHWGIIVSMVAVLWKLYVLKVKFLKCTLQKPYLLHLLSMSQQNIFRIIRMPLEQIIIISMPGTLMNQAMAISLLLLALLHPSLTNPENWSLLAKRLEQSIIIPLLILI